MRTPIVNCWLKFKIELLILNLCTKGATSVGLGISPRNKNQASPVRNKDEAYFRFRTDGANSTNIMFPCPYRQDY